MRDLDEIKRVNAEATGELSWFDDIHDDSIAAAFKHKYEAEREREATFGMRPLDAMPQHPVIGVMSADDAVIAGPFSAWPRETPVECDEHSG